MTIIPVIASEPKTQDATKNAVRRAGRSEQSRSDDKATYVRQRFDDAEIEPEIIGKQARRIEASQVDIEIS